MTKFLLAAVLGLSMLSFSTDMPAGIKDLAEVVECKHSQCKATAKSTGKQCKHCVSNAGDKFCWQHK